MAANTDLVYRGEFSGHRIPSLRAAILILCWTAGVLFAGRIDAGGVLSAGSDFIVPGRDRVVVDAVIARDGTAWLLGVDHTPGVPGGYRSYYAWQLDSDGRRTGEFVRLNDHPRLRNPGIVAPVGTRTNGDLVLVCETNRITATRVFVLLGPRGVRAVSEGLPPTDAWTGVFVTRDDRAWAFPVRLMDYVQVDLASAALPVVEAGHYADIFGDVRLIPRYIRRLRDTWSRKAFHDLGRGRLLVAVYHDDEGTRTVELYALDTRDFSLLDSGVIQCDADAHHAYEDYRVRKMRIVPAQDGGYWLFEPGVANPAGTTVYRVTSALQPVKPAAADTWSTTPFADMPDGGYVDIKCGNLRSDEISSLSERTSTYTQHLTMDFCGYGADGQLYLGKLEGQQRAGWHLLFR